MTITLDRSFGNTAVAEDSIHSAAEVALQQLTKITQTTSNVSAVFSAATSAAISALATPRLAGSIVPRKAAEDALERVMGALAQASNDPEKASADPEKVGLNLKLDTITKMPMDSMFMASTLLSNEILGNTVTSKCEVMKILTDKQERVRAEQLEDRKAQMAANLEQQDKAKKAGIISVVMDWVVAAVEVVTGVVKIVGGAMSGNPMMVAGGAMDLLAGCAGVVKAVANTLALVDPDNAEKYHDMAAKAGHVQMGFEIAGAMVDITSAVKNAIVAKIVPNVTKKVMQEGGEAIMNTAIKEGAKSATKAGGQEIIAAAATEIAKKVAAESAQLITTQLAKQTFNVGQKAGGSFIKKICTSKMVKTFSEEGVEKMVKESLESVGKKALKEGKDAATQKVTDQVLATLRNTVQKEAFKCAPAISGVVKTALGMTKGAQSLGTGIIDVQRAKIQKRIDTLIVDQQWNQMIFDLYDDAKKKAIDRVRELQQGQSSIIEEGVQTLNTVGITHAQLASSMV